MIVEAQVTKDFKHAFDSLQPQKRRIVQEKIDLLANNPGHPSLQTHKFENYLREELTKWLPDTPINQIGGELAMEAFADVDWRYRAALVLAGLQIGGSAT